METNAIFRRSSTIVLQTQESIVDILLISILYRYVINRNIPLLGNDNRSDFDS